METITYEQFKSMDIRVGTIKQVEPIEGTDKLLKCQVDTGDAESRQIISAFADIIRITKNLSASKCFMS